MDYKFFIDPKMKASKYLVYKCDSLPIEMMLTTDKTHANSIEDYNFCIEKHKTMNLIQIRLSSVRDNTSVFICTVDDLKFEHFKMEQSLYVTFETFVNHITEMVEKCRQNQLNILLTMSNKEFEPCKSQQFRLQFYEKGTFKNLEHITLPIERAPYEVILFHINQTYAYSQEENRILIQKNNNLQLESGQKDDQIEALNGVINGLKINLKEQEKVLKDRAREQMTRLEIEIKELNDAKNYQTQEFEKQIGAFKARVESLMKDNYSLSEQLQNEVKQTAKLRGENKKATQTIVALNQQIEQMNTDRLNQQSSVQKNDKVLADMRSQMNALEQKILTYKKQKQDLLAELEAERKTTEDICNANSIIRKQATEIEKLKRKVELSTEVALKQEQLLRQAGKGKENVTNIIEKISDTLKHTTEMNKVTEQDIKSIRDRTNFIENKYKDRIDDLYDQLCTIS